MDQCGTEEYTLGWMVVYRPWARGKKGIKESDQKNSFLFLFIYAKIGRDSNERLKKRKRLIFLVILSGIVILNLLAWMHARAMMQFSETGELTMK